MVAASVQRASNHAQRNILWKGDLSHAISIARDRLAL